MVDHPSQLWQKAVSFAARAHAGQARKGNNRTPYIAHRHRRPTVRDRRPLTRKSIAMHAFAAFRFWLGAALVSAGGVLPAAAAVVPASLFQDHMVLQRGMRVPIWGKADAGEQVAVSFAGQIRTATANAQGAWRVSLEPLEASAAPRELTIAGSNRIVIGDVLVGEVWLASGQSNMTMRVDPSFYPEEVAAAGEAPIRTAFVADVAALEPQDTAPIRWVVCTPQSIGRDFSAVGYFFAKRLYEDLHVPIGIVHSSWEGTPCEAWASSDAQLAQEELRAVARRQLDDMIRRPQDDEEFPTKMLAWEQKFRCADAGNRGFEQGWVKVDFDTSAWKPVTIPTDFRAAGLPRGGVVWFRKDVEIPTSAAGRSFVFNPGYTVDTVQAYWNGTELESVVGDKRRYYPHGQGFEVPAGLVKPGHAAISLRIYGHVEGHLWCTTKEMRIPLADAELQSNEWRSQVEQSFGDLSPDGLQSLPKVPTAQLQSTAGCLYNAKIHPLIPMALRGAIWYQGESNVERSKTYARLLETLIEDWRARWQQGPFPFYIVQLANLGRPWPVAEESDWAEIREAQLQVSRRVANTGLAVTIDIGDEHDIHPKNKRDVGTRLALIALAKTYGGHAEWSGPLFKSATSEGQSIRLRFSHCEGGLQAKDGPPRQFSIAGADRKFVAAEARVEGDSVVVSSPQVSEPAAVRYAWAKNPAGCNLINRAGLPASPFRTDAW